MEWLIVIAYLVGTFVGGWVGYSCGRSCDDR